jgi:DNA primase
LRWRRLPIPAAIRVGLLGPDGNERFKGRVVVPEIRRGQPIWLIGRTIDTKGEEPKYLSLPGRKPLLGWETACTHDRTFLVEGVFDWLTLRCWGFPAVALVGTNASPLILRALARFAEIYLVLDADQAGHQATTLLAQTLGTRAIPVFLSGVKDIAELAEQFDGRQVFVAAVNAVIQGTTSESLVPAADASTVNADHCCSAPAPAGEWPVLPPCQQIKEVSDGL